MNHRLRNRRFLLRATAASALLAGACSDSGLVTGGSSSTANESSSSSFVPVNGSVANWMDAGSSSSNVVVYGIAPMSDSSTTGTSTSYQSHGSSSIPIDSSSSNVVYGISVPPLDAGDASSFVHGSAVEPPDASRDGGAAQVVTTGLAPAPIDALAKASDPREGP